MGTQLDMFASPPAKDPPTAPRIVMASNATGLTYSDFLRITECPDEPKTRRMWEADYDAIEVMHIQRGTLPGPLGDPADAGSSLADRITFTMQRQIRRAEADNKALEKLHADILGCSVDDLDAVVAKQKADEKATCEAARVPKTITSSEPRRSHSAKPNNLTNVPMRRLTSRQQELLACLVVEGDRAVFGPDDRIDDWPALKQVMTTLGATWKTGGKKTKGAFVFRADVDAAETLRLAKEHGEIFDPKLVGTFLTPDALADYAASKLVLVPNTRVLEPSAGRGSLVKAARRACPEALIECVELLEPHQKDLRALGLSVIGTDFLAMRPEEFTMFDAVLMNPPFNKGAEAHHVLHAAKFVMPGGQVVAIVSQGVFFRQDSPYREFAQWVRAHGGVEELPAGSFKESGTMVNTALVVAKTCEWCRTGKCWEK